MHIIQQRMASFVLTLISTSDMLTLCHTTRTCCFKVSNWGAGTVDPWVVTGWIQNNDSKVNVTMSKNIYHID